MTESMFKLGQTYKTRGTQVNWLVVYIGARTLLAVNEAESSDSEWFFLDGYKFVGRETLRDLMPHTKTVTRYLNVYPNWVEDHAWADEVAADKYAGSDRIACIPYKVTLPDDDSEAT